MMAPVFIVGCDRSGTTLLRLMLSRSREFHIPAETGFIPELWTKRDAYGDFSDARDRWFFIRDLQHTRATSKTSAFDAFSLDIDCAEAAIAASAPTNYAGAVAALFAASAARAGKRAWGDKTPRYVLHVDLLASLFPGSRIVHIIRDPRDVAASILAAGWAGTFGRAAAFWRDRVSAGRIAGRALGPARYREVRYERLVLEPERELQALGEWLGLTYTPAMLSYHEDAQRAVPPEHRELFPLLERPVDPTRAAAWRRTLSRRATAEVEAVARDLMIELGYEPTGLRVPAWVIGVRWAFDCMLPVATRLRDAGVISLAPTQSDDERSRYAVHI